MRFTDRWDAHAKRKYHLLTRDNDIHNNGASIIAVGRLDYNEPTEFVVSAFRNLGKTSVSMTTNSDLPKTFDEAKELAEQFIEKLYKLED